MERALPHIERAHGIRFIALRYFNAAGAHPDGTIGEDHDPEIHLIPRAMQAATGGPPLKVFGEDYPTPDGTCLRDYIHVCDLADAHVLRARRADAAAPRLAVYNVGTGTPHSVRAVIDTVSRVVGAPVRWEPAPRRAGRSGGALCLQRSPPAGARLAAALPATSTTIVRARLAVACQRIRTELRGPPRPA